jgi:ubiquinone/menaquinone biosynthesis C-methylase UbiE
MALGWIDSHSERSTFLRLLSPAPGEKILDVGAGKGSVARVVFEEGSEVHALEPDRGRITSIKKNLPGVMTSNSRCEDLPYPEGYFDKAYATMAVHHFEDQPKSFAEVARVLKPNGVFVVMDFSSQTIGGRLARFFENTLFGNSFRFLAASELSEMLKHEGMFEITEIVRLSSTYFIRAVKGPF